MLLALRCVVALVMSMFGMSRHCCVVLVTADCADFYVTK